MPVLFSLFWTMPAKSIGWGWSFVSEEVNQDLSKVVLESPLDALCLRRPIRAEGGHFLKSAHAAFCCVSLGRWAVGPFGCSLKMIWFIEIRLVPPIHPIHSVTDSKCKPPCFNPSVCHVFWRRIKETHCFVGIPSFREENTKAYRASSVCPLLPRTCNLPNMYYLLLELFKTSYRFGSDSYYCGEDVGYRWTLTMI